MYCRSARSICQSGGRRIRSVSLDRHSQEHIGSQMESALWPVSVQRLSLQLLFLFYFRSSTHFTGEATCFILLFVLHSYIGKTDSITISIWNHKKIHKRQGAGFLGCIRLLSNAISRLKDTGCRSLFSFLFWRNSHDPSNTAECHVFFDG